MIETQVINADGTYRLNGGDPTRKSEGSIVIINPNGAHTYTLGVIREDNSTFKGYTNGTFSEDVHVRHGVGAILAVNVSGLTPGDDLQFGYTG